MLYLEVSSLTTGTTTLAFDDVLDKIYGRERQDSLPCSKTNRTVPTTGMKFNGKYMTYLIRDFGENF